MAKRSVRRERHRQQRRDEAGLGPQECEAVGCTEFPFERIEVPGTGRTVAVCGRHGRLIRAQIARNENAKLAKVGAGDPDIEVVQRELRPGRAA